MLAAPWSKPVSRIAPGWSCSISPRISSSPGASGTDELPGREVGLGRLGARFAARPAAGPLLGTGGAVALTPALVGVALDLALQLGEAVEDRLRPRRAAGDVDVDRHELVGTLYDRVVGEHAAAGGAGAHRDRPLRLQHLVIEAADDRRHLDRDPAREDDHVGLAWRGTPGLSAKSGNVVSRRDG